MTRREWRWLRWTFGLLILIAVLLALGLESFVIPPLEIVARLLIGWVSFITRVFPALHWRRDLVISTAVYLLVLTVALHLFLRWLSGAMANSSALAPWRFRWTVSSLAIVLLMFAAGTAATGITHQTTWLARSPVPIFRENDSRKRAHRVKCASNLKQISAALQLYANDKGGQFPTDWDAFITDADFNFETLVCPSSNDERAIGFTPGELLTNFHKPGHCSYVLVAAGQRPPLSPDRVIAFEPLANHDGAGANVLYGDGRVEWIDGNDFAKLLATTRPATAPAPP